MVSGTVGNILVLIVYRHQYKRSVTRMFIFMLAALDIGNCLITMPTELLILTNYASFPSPVWCKITRYLTYIFNGASSIILITIALDRYFKVCKPTKVGINIRRARMVCFGSFIFTAIFCIPALIIYGDMAFPIQISEDKVSILPLSALQNLTVFETGIGQLGSDSVTQSTRLIVLGHFCLLSTRYIDGNLPKVFYAAMLSLYATMIFFVVFFYSRVARAMFVLTRKHSRMFTFYMGREDSAPNSALPEELSVKYNRQGSNVIIQEVSTFDEDGPFRPDGSYWRPESNLEVDDLDAKVHDENKPNDDTASNNELNRTFDDFTMKNKHRYSSHEQHTNITNNENGDVQPGGKQAPNGGLISPVTQSNQNSGQHQQDKDSPSPTKIKPKPKSGKIPKIKVQDLSQLPGLIHASSTRSTESNDSPYSSNSLLLRRFKSAESVNALTHLHKLHVPDQRKIVPVFPDAYEVRLPKVSNRKQRRDNNACVGQVTKSCVNIDYVGGEEDALDPCRASSEKTLTLTRKTSPQGKKKLCVLPLTGLSTKTAIRTQETNEVSNKSLETVANKNNSQHCVDGKSKGDNDKFKNNELASPDEESNVTLRVKTPEVVTTAFNHASLNNMKTPESARQITTPRQEIVSTADILQEHHNRGSLHPFRTSRMLFIISLVFVISFLPFFIIALVRSSIGSSFASTLSDTELCLVSIFIRSSLLSNAVNPIIYGLLSSHFRKECSGLLRCLRHE
ncbi:uncharacterized protein LOC131955463 [Physella acuta]|uniref:uncharacterized protein LOC131955463 n=1 Tax=Physella acuta TaxID=109671 RepID=UPI0027DADF2A|nr:uncharacterized protein LOC131955463 [Physella acuta]